MAVWHMGLRPRVESWFERATEADIEADVGNTDGQVSNQPYVQEDTSLAGATMMDLDSTN